MTSDLCPLPPHYYHHSILSAVSRILTSDHVVCCYCDAHFTVPGEVAAVAGPGPSQDQGTRAISVQQLSLGAVGDCSVWEFSG